MGCGSAVSAERPTSSAASLSLDGRPFTVVGVMPPGFNYPPGGVELWVPLAFSAQDETERASALPWRARPPRSRRDAGAARAEPAATWPARLEQTHPRTNSGRTFAAVRLREQQAGLTGPFVALFQGAALLVLMMACANVGGVAAGPRPRPPPRDGPPRRAGREPLAHRRASSSTESLCSRGSGGLLALGVAAAGVRTIRASVPEDITKWVAGWSEIRLDARARRSRSGRAGAPPSPPASSPRWPPLA